MQGIEMSEQQLGLADESSCRPNSQKVNAFYGASGSSSSSSVYTISSLPAPSPSSPTSSSSAAAAAAAAATFPDEVLEHVLAFITSHRDRNAISLVCKAWFKADQWSRANVFIGNCYSCSPRVLTRRFPNVKSLTLKGKPRFSDFNLVPANWGANVSPWLYELAMGTTPCLEELRLKRMTVTDESLEFIGQSFPNFSSLVLIFCDGFSTDGLTAIAANCRNLTELDIQECTIDDRGGEWLSAFPETFTSLTSLNLTNFSSEVSFTDLERIVTKCENLKKLKLNRGITSDQLRRLLLLAGHRLKELGIGSFVQDVDGKSINQIASLFESCKSIRTLSGLWEVVPHYLPLMYPLCSSLRNLNLSDSPISSPDFVRMIYRCHSLECLWVQDLVEDRGLEAVAMTCEKLRELRVVPSDTSRSLVTEKGMVAISRHCRDLRYILFFCNQMTNAAMHEFAANCPNMTHFRLCIMKRWEPDYITKQPMDEGFGAIVRSCSHLRRLSVSGLLTDRAFELIGKYAKRMRSLSLAFVGDTGVSMDHLMRGCKSLKKLEIRDCPFGDVGVLSGVGKYYEMRSLWMSACDVSFAACKVLASQMPLLNVEVIVEDDREFPSGKQSFSHNKGNVEKLYVYRTVSGPRRDHPPCVYTL